VSDLALVILAEMRENASKAVDHSGRGGDRWEEDDLIVDAVANRVRQVTELAPHLKRMHARPVRPGEWT
jgi:hypothetical protein